MEQHTIWFNRGLSSTVHVIESMRRAQRPDERLRVITSHIRMVPAAGVSDLFVIEPKELDEDPQAYIDWYLQFAHENGVNVFIPRNLNFLIAGQLERFEQEGVKVVVVADQETMRILKNKVRLYETVGADLVPLPAYREATDLGAFQAAVAELGGGRAVCFKPTEGIGGRGFHVLSDDVEIVSPWTQEVMSVTTPRALELLSASEQFKPQIVMEYLPGQERSADCLAHQGELVAATVRVKSMDGSEELLEDNALLVEYCRRLTRNLKLNGLYNIQFMQGQDGVQYLLEINARMAGGIHYGEFSGVCLPYWAVKLALGLAVPADVPVPKTGIRVSRKTREVVTG